MAADGRRARAGRLCTGTVAIALCAIVAQSLVANPPRWLLPTPPTPTLAVGAAAARRASFDLGAFTVTWDGGAGQLAVRRGGAAVWSTRAGRPFVAAARADGSVVEGFVSGNFAVHEHVRAMCVAQRVDEVTAVEREGAAARLRVSGGFDDDVPECAHAPWVLELTDALPDEGAVGGGPRSPNQLRFTLEVLRHGEFWHQRQHLNRVQLALSAPDANATADAACWGFGAQFRHFNLRGHCVPTFVTEQGIFRNPDDWSAPLSLVMTRLMNLVCAGSGGNDYTTSTASAAFTCSTGSGIVLENTELAIFDLGSGDCARKTSLLATPHAAAFGALGAGRDTFAIGVRGPAIRGRLLAPAAPYDAPTERGAFVGASAHLGVVSALTEYTGRMAPLPPFADDGAILGLQGGAAGVSATVDRVRAAGVPTVAVWLQDWVGLRRVAEGSRLWWNWAVDASLYPDWVPMRAALAAKGVRVLTYVNSYVTDVERSAEEDGKSARDRWHRHLYREGTDGGHFVRAADGSVAEKDALGFDHAVVDLTSASARAWMKGVIAAMADEQVEVSAGAPIERAGSSGWMADFAEGLPCDGVTLADGRDPCAYHSQYATDWAELNRQVLRETGREGDTFFWSRSGYTTGPRSSTLYWLMDSLTTWDKYDGMGSALTASVSCGMSGISLNHADLGGCAHPARSARDPHARGRPQSATSARGTLGTHVAS